MTDSASFAEAVAETVLNFQRYLDDGLAVAYSDSEEEINAAIEESRTDIPELIADFDVEFDGDANDYCAVVSAKLAEDGEATGIEGIKSYMFGYVLYNLDTIANDEFWANIDPETQDYWHSLECDSLNFDEIMSNEPSDDETLIAWWCKAIKAIGCQSRVNQENPDCDCMTFLEEVQSLLEDGIETSQGISEEWFTSEDEE